MDPTLFVNDRFGAPYRDAATGWDFYAFAPAPLPRSLDLDRETVLALSRADNAVGRLAGAGRLLRDPNIFVRPYAMREALASSQIEGTVTSLSEVFRAEAANETPDSVDVREVLNYMAAMERGLGRVRTEEWPLVGRIVREIHEVLMRGVRGEDRSPGEFRQRPVWIGSPTDAPETAVFVPPLPNELRAAWSDWEQFANATLRMPVLVQCALLHYQFETIHPFLDGNGRVGRLLIAFFLSHKGTLPAPLLYLSTYLEQSRREYYDRLQAVRERGEIQEWLQYFLTAAAVQAEDAIARAERLYDLRESYRVALVGTRSRAPEVVDLLFANPVVTVRRVETSLHITNQGARNMIRVLEQRGWLREVGTFGRGGRVFWVAHEVYAALSDPASDAPVPGEATVG